MKYITQMFNIIFDKYAIHINDNLIQEILLSIKKRKYFYHHFYDYS